MNIGIDLDGTITDFYNFIVNYAKDKYKIKDENGFEIEEIFDLNESELASFKELIRKNLRMEVKPRDGASLYINKLHDLGFKIFIITSRKDRDLIDPLLNTKKWLKDNNIYYDKLVIGNSNKLEECINNKIDIFIDDKIKHCSKTKIANIKTFIFDNIYNKNSDIDRVYSFEELFNLIKEFI